MNGRFLPLFIIVENFTGVKFFSPYISKNPTRQSNYFFILLFIGRPLRPNSAYCSEDKPPITAVKSRMIKAPASSSAHGEKIFSASL